MKRTVLPQKTAVVLCAFGLMTSASFASDFIGTGTGGNSSQWERAENWSDGVPDGAGAIADIMVDVPETTGSVTINMQNIDRTVGQLLLGDTNQAKTVTLRNGTTTVTSTGILTFDNVDENAQLTVRAATNGTTFIGAGVTGGARPWERTAMDVHLKSNLDLQSIGTSNGASIFHVRLAAGDSGNYTLNLTANSTSTGPVIFQGANSDPRGQVNAGYITDGTAGGTIAVQQSSAATALHLYSNNSYSGGTLVSAGTLIVNNTKAEVTDSGTGSGDVVLHAGTTLGGFGNVGGDVITQGGANLQVGFGGTGGFTIDGDLDLGGDLNVIYGDVIDLLTVGGNLNLGGYVVTFNLTGYEGDEMQLLSFAGLTGGDIDNFFVSGVSSYEIELRNDGVYLVIPEPSTYAAIITSLALGIALIRRRKR